MQGKTNLSNGAHNSNGSLVYRHSMSSENMVSGLGKYEETKKGGHAKESKK